MIDIKKILCPTDFSDASLEALDTAHGLALRFGAELHLVHCVEPIPMPASPTAQIGMAAESVDIAGYEKHLMGQAEESLAELAKKHETQDVEIQTHLTEGRPQNAIVDCAREIGADLLVVSTHGTSGWKRFVFGSVADKIIRTSPCPVLSITPEQED